MFNVILDKNKLSTSDVRWHILLYVLPCRISTFLSYYCYICIYIDAIFIRVLWEWSFLCIGILFRGQRQTTFQIDGTIRKAKLPYISDGQGKWLIWKPIISTTKYYSNNGRSNRPPILFGVATLFRENTWHNSTEQIHPFWLKKNSRFLNNRGWTLLLQKLQFFILLYQKRFISLYQKKKLRRIIWKMIHSLINNNIIIIIQVWIH